MKTSWSRAEIMALPRAEFDFYTSELVKLAEKDNP